MARKPHGAAIVLTALALLTTGIAGAGVAAVLLGDPVPASLASTPEASFAPVTERTISDPRPLEMHFTLAPETPISSPRTGLVTQFRCEAETSLVSGQSNLSIDGEPILNLATKTPLWRDLRLGDTGDDVEALQTELGRLGYGIDPHESVGRATFEAVDELLGVPSGVREVDGPSLSMTRILWIPALETSLRTCESSVGTRVEAGGRIANVSGGPPKFALSKLPDSAVSGNRVLRVDDVIVPLEKDGTVGPGDASARLSATPSFASAVSEGTPTFPAVSELAAPRKVHVVPPAALTRVDGSVACVTSGTDTYAVTVVASELGQSYVAFESETVPRRVSLNPPAGTACR